jgi:RHS repeat-associated protein
MRQQKAETEDQSNARLYDPTLGKFLSPDGVVAFPYDMQQLNRYSYVDNNPLSDTDPTGNIINETVDGFLYADPATLPLAIIATVAEVVADILGLGGLFGGGPAPVGFATTPAAPTPAASAGNPSGISQVQNTAAQPAAASDPVPTSEVVQGSFASRTISPPGASGISLVYPATRNAAALRIARS